MGNIWSDRISRPKPILRVGDNYEITIEANDPKDRKISYKLESFNRFKMVQESNRFNFEITNEMVGKSVYFLAIVETPDLEYKNSELLEIPLTILPK